MSYPALRWAFGKRLDKPVQQAVLVCLAFHHNMKTGLSFPGTSTIIAETRFKERAIQGAINDLIDLDLVSSRNGQSGRGHHRTFIIHLKNPAGDAVLSADNPAAGADNPAPDAPNPAGRAEVKEEGNSKEPEKECPEWFESISKDPRWSNEMNDSKNRAYVTSIETDWSNRIDLGVESSACYHWLQDSPKGKKKRYPNRVFKNWCANAARFNKYKKPSERAGDLDGDKARDQWEQDRRAHE